LMVRLSRSVMMATAADATSAASPPCLHSTVHAPAHSPALSVNNHA
jgi:hypothetical protein